MANAVTTVLGKVQPIYKGQYYNNVSYSLLDNVVYDGSGYVSLQDNNQNHIPTEANSQWWKLVVSKGNTGSRGPTGSFGTPTASAHSLETGATPTVEVTASGPDEGKIFSFNFGIPNGPYGFDDVTGTATPLAAGDPATVSVALDTSGSERLLTFDFGIPAADGQGAQSVDSVAADSNNNVQLSAVRYVVQSLSNLQKNIACTNIGAIASPASPSFGGFLKYGGTIDNPLWVTEMLEAISTSTIDTIVV